MSDLYRDPGFYVAGFMLIVLMIGVGFGLVVWVTVHPWTGLPALLAALLLVYGLWREEQNRKAELAARVVEAEVHPEIWLSRNVRDGCYWTYADLARKNEEFLAILKGGYLTVDEYGDRGLVTYVLTPKGEEVLNRYLQK